MTWGPLTEENSVPLAPFVEAFERSGMSAVELAERCGVFRKVKNNRSCGDASWAMRRLGLRPDPVSKAKGGGAHLKSSGRLSIAVAERIMLALDLDPVDVGL